jgi:flagellar motor switch protein FliM
MASSDNFLSQGEVDALLKGVTGDTDVVVAPVDTSGVRTYNLATQERIVRGRMPTLEMINERFARFLRIGLYNYLRRSTEVSAGPVCVMKYSEFIRNLPVPTSLNLVQMKPLRGIALMALDPSLVFRMIDSLFGGNGQFHTRVEGRDFTQTEQRIILRVLEVVFESYSKSWAPVHPVSLEFIRSEINTQFVNIATPNEVVICTTFTIELGETSGEMHFCLPYSMIEPVRDLLSSSLQGEALEHDNRWTKLLTQQIQIADLELIANIATANTTLRKLLDFQVGDVIPIDIPDIVLATVDNVPVLECQNGTLNGRYALRVNKMILSQHNEIKKSDPNDK